VSLTEPDDWTEPGAYAVGHGIHRVPLPLPQDGLRAVNVYVIETDAGLVLVDSGWALLESESLLEEALGTLGYGLQDITRFLVTHIHRDHYSQAVALRDVYGADVYLGIGEQESLADLQGRGPDDFLTTEITALVAAGAEELASILRNLSDLGDTEASGWTDPDTWMLPGDRIEVQGRTLDVIATPGHTRGHMVFHDAGLGLLFAGDHVLPSITPSIGFEPVRARLPLRSYLDSLTLLLDLDDCVLLPAHGAPGGSVHARVRQLLEHHAIRLDEMESAIRDTTSTAFEVAQRVTWTRRNRSFGELDPFNQMLAVLETDSHLGLLVADHRLTDAPSNGGIRCYSELPLAGPLDGHHTRATTKQEQ
jgi:glyoxylase-like metal-dependent hydrolase (beta-lactamase superfamily II)